MATIKGVTVKGIKSFKGHEGELCQQGNIYLDGIKVGYYSDSFTMGPAEISFDSNEIEQKVEGLCNEYYKEHPTEKWHADSDADLEEFFANIFELIDMEKKYKKNCKKGYETMALFEEGNPSNSYILTCKSLEVAKKCIEENSKITKYKIFTSMDDFTIK